MISSLACPSTRTPGDRREQALIFNVRALYSAWHYPYPCHWVVKHVRPAVHTSPENLFRLSEPEENPRAPEYRRHLRVSKGRESLDRRCLIAVRFEFEACGEYQRYPPVALQSETPLFLDARRHCQRQHGFKNMLREAADGDIDFHFDGGRLKFKKNVRRIRLLNGQIF